MCPSKWNLWILVKICKKPLSCALFSSYICVVNFHFEKFTCRIHACDCSVGVSKWVSVCVWVLDWNFWSLWTVKSERAGIDYSLHFPFVLVWRRVCVCVFLFPFHSKSHSNCCLYTWTCFDCRFTCCYCCRYAARWLAIYQGVVVTCACKWKRHSYCFSVDMCVFSTDKLEQFERNEKKCVWNSMLHALRRSSDSVEWMIFGQSRSTSLNVHTRYSALDIEPIDATCWTERSFLLIHHWNGSMCGSESVHDTAIAITAAAAADVAVVVSTAAVIDFVLVCVAHITACDCICLRCICVYAVFMPMIRFCFVHSWW